MFTHLHVHTEYSLLDGMAKIPDLMDRAVSLGQEAVAMTDHGGLYGAIDFYREATKRNVKPILGVETYVAHGSRLVRDSSERDPYHLVLLARTNEGYRNLVQLVTKSHLEGYYYKPRIDRELLEQHSAGLIALSGCPSAEFHRRIQEGDRNGAIDVARWYREVFDGHYYLEVQDHGDEKFTRFNPAIADVGRELGIPVVATNDSHFTSPDQAYAHEVLLCVSSQTTINDEKRFKLDGEGYYLRSEDEMRALYPDNPEFIENTQLVADSCDVHLDFSRQILPEPAVPEGRTSADYLKELCYNGLRERYEETTQELSDRLDYELDVLLQTGFTDYIYVVKETADQAHELGIRMGVRGSAAASLVLYTLGVTDIDPVGNGLVFERFLNLERREMPDVDFDFADDRRDEMIRWAYERYGEDKVAQIITFGTMGAKAAIRDVGRALGLSYAETDRIARLIPNQLNISLGEALQQSQELRDAVQADPNVNRLYETARQLEGVARHASTHAAGVVISRDPLIETVPLQRPNRGDETSIPTTQFAMEQIASIGLVKMDYLGLSNLTILQRAIELIQSERGVEIDLWALEDGDPLAMEMLGRGETFGVFQLESSGMRRYIQDLKPTCIADLCAMVALYRPGPMQHIPRFIDGKHGKIEITYPHPDLAPVLDETYGVIVYQDQVLLIARKFAGYSLGQADIMRKAMGKKKKEVMEAERERFIEGAIGNGYSRDEAEAVFELIEPFAGYAFNKAHSWCYGNIAYQTAYLKANYPVEYMAALLQLTKSAADPHERISAAVAECTRIGIDVRLPDINLSSENFTIEREGDSAAIRFGLGVPKNVGSSAVEGIIAGRRVEGVEQPYVDIDDLLARADLSNTNARAFEHLIKAGALDGLGERGTLLAGNEQMLAYAKSERERRESGQTSMFDVLGGGQADEAPRLELPKHTIPQEQCLAWEKELLGVYLSEHPYRSVAADVSRLTTLPLREVTIEAAGQSATIAGIVTQVQPRTTRDGRRFLIAALEDLEASCELLVWGDIIEAHGAGFWQEGKILVCTVDIRDRGGELGLSVRNVAEFDRADRKLVGADGTAEVSLPPPGAGSSNGRRGRGGPPREREAQQPGGERPRAAQDVQRNGGAARRNGNGYGNGYVNGNGNAATVPASRAADGSQLLVTIYETENERADRARFDAMIRILREAGGNDPVRLVVNDAEGHEAAFDLPDVRVEASEDLAQVVRDVLQKNGAARVVALREAAGAR